MRIHEDLIKLRRLVGGLKAEVRQGVSFKVKMGSALMEKIRSGADDLGMPMAGAPIKVDFTSERVPTEKGIDTLVTVATTLRFMSGDGTYVDFVGLGQGGDKQDKAAGKAFSYAWKSAIIQALSLPDDDMLDTDMEEHPFGKPEAKKVAKPFSAVVDMLNRVNTKYELEAAEIEVKKYKWEPTERSIISEAHDRAQLRVTLRVTK